MLGQTVSGAAPRFLQRADLAADFASGEEVGVGVDVEALGEEASSSVARVAPALPSVRSQSPVIRPSAALMVSAMKCKRSRACSWGR